MRFHVPNNELDKYFEDKEKEKEEKKDEDEESEEDETTAAILFNNKIHKIANIG